MVVVEIPREYGYVVLVGTSSVFVAMWHGIRVSLARKKFGIKVGILICEICTSPFQFRVKSFILVTSFKFLFLQVISVVKKYQMLIMSVNRYVK